MDWQCVMYGEYTIQLVSLYAAVPALKGLCVRVTGYY